MEIDTSFERVLTKGIQNAPEGTNYVAVHVSSGHMAIFYEYYDTLQDIDKEKGYELIVPQCASNIKIVWDMKAEELVYYDLIGLTSSAHDYWEDHRGDPCILPKVEPEIPQKPFTEDVLMEIATKTSNRIKSETTYEQH